MSPQINVVIDRIVLDSPMSRSDRALLAAAVTEQLSSMLGGGAGGAGVGVVGSQARPPTGQPGLLGYQIAAAVHAALPAKQLGSLR
ncbi:MAG: hypothetical protein ABI140_11470 [Jatrophihabitantaceae bacterium]